MSLLPTASAPNTPGFLGPNYDFADNLPLPGQIGVRRDDSLGSVIDAVKGAAYYIDMIGFGEPSGPLTRSMRTKPTRLGVNYFLRTGLQCSNGADMYFYVNGIPDGSALGEKIKQALRSSGLPQLRGLAPGILEDAKDALNPQPVLNAILGSGYPKCKKVTLPVGDVQGRIEKDGERWIEGPVQRIDGMPHQTRWVQDTNQRGQPVFLTKNEYDAELKLFCPDGSTKANHQDGDCAKPALREGFTTSTSDLEQWILAASLTVAAITAVGFCLKQGH
jgi:hypothetical protein